MFCTVRRSRGTTRGGFFQQHYTLLLTFEGPKYHTAASVFIPAAEMAHIRLDLRTLLNFSLICVTLFINSLPAVVTMYRRPNIVLILTDDLDVDMGGMVS